MALHVTLDEPQGLNLAAKCMTTLSVGINILATFLVLTKPGELKAYRWFLLNYMLTSCAFDVYMSFLMAPVFLFPYVAGYTTGILWSFFGISSHAQMVRSCLDLWKESFEMFFWYLSMCQSNSTLLTFYWRFQAAVLPGSFWKFSNRTTAAFIVGVYTLPMISPIIGAFGRNERTQLFEFLRNKKDEVALKLLEEPSTEIYIAEINAYWHIAIASGVAYVTLSFIGIFILIGATLRTLLKRTPNARHERNRRVQLDFLRCLMIQIMLPIGLLIIPLIVINLSIWRDWDIQKLPDCRKKRPLDGYLKMKLTGTPAILEEIYDNPASRNVDHWMIMTFSIHSPVATMIVLAYTTPYRRAVVSLLKAVAAMRHAPFLSAHSQSTVAAIEDHG